MKRGGRPSRFTEEVGTRVLNAIRLGALVQDAAAFAGVPISTLYQWLEDGPKKPAAHPLRKFSEAVAIERASVKTRATGRVLAGMKEDWRAAAWWLSVTDPRNFGPKVRVSVEAELNEALDRLQERLTPAVYGQVLAALAGDVGAGEIVEGETGEPRGATLPDGVDPPD